MAKFVYRLQKIFELRERRYKEQEQRVIEAKRRVTHIEGMIEAKKNEIRLLHQNMLTAPHTLMSSHDQYIHKCNLELDQLHEDLEEAKRRHQEEVRLLARYHSELKALEKHKEKAHEEWLEEEKRIEMKELDEIASQRYFRAKLAEAEDELAEALELEESES